MDTHASGTWQQKMLGRYKLLRLLGRGGMGEVWLAEDTQLLRQVAIKVLPSVLAADRGYLEDFAREARAAAALEHPHILPVHDFGEQQIGEDEIVTYLVTPYMSGGSLRERILAARGPLPATEVMSYLRQAAQAIDYAHSQHMLHRDIKPANMLLEQSWLFLADFGLAKLLTSTTQRSRTYAGSGTPEYMAPEQAHGKAEAASDRYSFAMTAYQLVTGKVPFRGETPYSTLIMQMTSPPPSPRIFNPELPEAVEQALLWGLAKDPADRPASCMALVHALEHGWQMQTLPQLDAEATMLATWNTRAIDNPSSPASPNIPSVQPALTPRLPPTNPSLAGGLLAANREAEREKSLLYGANDPTYISDISGSAERARQAERQPGKITRRAVLAGGAAAAVAVAAGGAALFLHSRSTPTQSGQPVAQKPAGPRKLMAGVPLLSLVGHTQPVRVARWSPGGGRYLATAGEDAYVMLWDISGNIQPSSNDIQSLSKPLRSWKLPENILAGSLCWSPDGSTLAAVTGSNKVYLMRISVSGGTPTIYQDSSANGGTAPAYTAIAWSPRANTFATPAYMQGQTRQVVDIWQMGHTNAPVQALTSNATGTARTAIIDVVHPFNATAPLNALSWSSDGSLLAAHTSFGSVTIWQAAAEAIKQTLSLPVRPTKDHPLYVLNECLAWSPLKANLLAVSNIDLIALWDVQQNAQLLALKSTDPVPSLTGLTWSPNGSYLAGSYAGSPRIYVWDVQELPSGTGADQNTAQSQKLFFPRPGTHVHTATITDVAWSPDGRYIATASGDTTAVVWKVDAS